MVFAILDTRKTNKCTSQKITKKIRISEKKHNSQIIIGEFTDKQTTDTITVDLTIHRDWNFPTTFDLKIIYKSDDINVSADETDSSTSVGNTTTWDHIALDKFNYHELHEQW